MKIIDKKQLDILTEKAKVNVRLRMNYNFHTSSDSKAQRLLNALEPGTILPIHRHLHSSETFVLLKGSLRILFYDDNKKNTDTICLNMDEGTFGIDIPAEQWHTIEALESGTVIFEVKDGPYKPIESNDILD